MASSRPTLPFDPFALAQAAGEAAIGLAARPAELLNVQLEAAKQWSEFWSDALSGKPSEKPRDRRFSAPEWQDDPYYRTISDGWSKALKLAFSNLPDFPGYGLSTPRLPDHI